MLERFLRGEDRSLRFVNAIEAHLDKNFRGTPIYEDLIEPLATYRPGGGEFLIDEDELARKFEYALRTWLSTPRTEVQNSPIQNWMMDVQRVLIEACLKHRVPFFWRTPGTMLISAKGMRTVLKEVSAEGYRVLGMEAFELESPDVHPRLDLIFDASLQTEIEDPSVVAANWPEDLWVDVTLATRKETDDG